MTSQAHFHSLKRNYFFSVLSAVVGILYPIITMAYVARALGPEALGKYYFANSLAAYFLFAAGMGIPVYGVREVGRNRGDPQALKAAFSELFTINFVSNVLVAVLYAGVVLAVPDLRAEGRLFAVTAVLFLSGAFSFDFLYAGLERQDLITYRSFASKVVGIILILTLVKGPEDYVRFAGVVAVAALVHTALGLRGLKYWSGWKTIRMSALAPHVRPIFFIALASLFINVYINLDSVIVGLIASSHEVGLYNAAMRPCRLVVVVVASLVGVALPRLAYYAQDAGHGSAQRNLQKKSLELLLFISVPIASLFIASAGPVIGLLYGPAFADAAASLPWAALLIVVNGISTFHIFQILLPMGRERALVAAAVAGASASVALNLALVPAFGFKGAVVAALGAEAAGTLVQVYLIRKAGPGLLVFSNQAWKYLAAGVALGLSQVCLQATLSYSPGTILASWTLSAAVYCLTLWALREPLIREAALRLRGFARP